MKRKFTYLLLAFFLLLTSKSGFSQNLLWYDDFESTNPSSGARVASYEGGYGGPPHTRYFKRALLSTISSGYTGIGIQGNYFWAAEDNDGAVNGISGYQDEEQSVTWTGINISGRTPLEFKGLFATGETTTFDHGNSTINADFMVVEYNIDNTGWHTLLDFRPNQQHMASGALAVDSDGDGLGDGQALTKNFVEFSRDIPGKGTTLQLRIIVRSNSQAEEVAFDYIRVYEKAICTEPIFTTQPVSTITCDGTSTSFSAMASGASAYQWQESSDGSNWTDVSNTGFYSGATTSTLVITSPTTSINEKKYRCKAINGLATCFTSSATATLTVSAPTYTKSSYNLTCFNSGNGSATITPAGGASYTYAWSNGKNTASITNLSAGSYTVTITDANGCKKYESFVVTQPAASVSAFALNTPVSCFGGSNGTATVVASGGTPGYSYSWAPTGGTGNKATGLAAGQYTCTITDANGCQTTATTVVTQPVAALSASAIKTDVSCNGGSNGTATVTASGGTGVYKYFWTPVGGTARTATGLSAGKYTCVVEDANTCQTSVEVTITQPVALAASATKTDVSCNGGSNGTATVTASGGTGVYKYFWTPVGGTARTATGLSAGKYTCIIEDANTCQTSLEVAITQPTALSASFVVTNVSCNGGSNGSVTVTRSGGTSPYSYSWSPGGGVAGTASGLSAGKYTCTITDFNGCETSVEATVTEPPALSASISKTDVSCNGGMNGTATVTVSGGSGAGSYSYSWSPMGGTAPTATGLSAGQYTCTITDAYSCQTFAETTILQPAPLSISKLQTDVSCNGGNNGSATVVVSGGTGTYTYSWSPGGGTGATASNLAPGTYYCTITDGNSCQQSARFDISQPPALIVSTSKTDNTCINGQLGNAAVTVSGGTPGYSYSWAPGGETTSSISNLRAGTYTCTVSDANNCKIHKSVTVAEPSPITISASPLAQNVCSGSAVSISLIPSVGDATVTWEAKPVSGSVTNMSSGSGLTINQILSGHGVVEYTISASKGDCLGTGTTSVLVTVNGNVAVFEQPKNRSVYDEENTSFSVVAEHATSYQWQVDMGDGFVNVSNDIHYNGAHTATLTINNVLGAMHDYGYRCVVSGNCGSATSTTATLSVKTRTVQTISFAATDEKVYGTADYVPAATTNSGLALTYTSSDETIAAVVEGKIRIKKAGQVTITASQNGNNDFKPATSVPQVLTIVKRSVTVTILSNPSITKEYDGETDITLADGNYSITDKISGDDLTVTGIANFLDAQAGEEKSIAVTNLVLAGTGMENYVLTSTSAAAKGTITRKPITVQFGAVPAINKVYNGDATALVVSANFTISGALDKDDVNVAEATAVYSDKHVGTAKSVTATNFVLGGADKDNYLVSTLQATASGSILAKELSVSFSTNPVISKNYDGTTEITIPEGKYQLEGIVAGDDVSIIGVASFDNKNIGFGKTITVDEIGLLGADKNNYSLVSQTATTSGQIIPATVTVALQNTPVTKVYDATASATLSANNYIVTGLVSGDDIAVNLPLSGTYNNSQAGSGKAVTVDGLYLTGSDAYNYELGTSSASANVGVITPKPITVVAQPATKQYGTADPLLEYSFTGLLGSETLDGSLTRTQGRNVGTYAISLGTLAPNSNYTIAQFTPANLTITPAPLTITADDKVKKQGEANPVFTFTYDGLVDGDQPLSLKTPATATTRASAATLVGNYSIVVGGATSDNYTITFRNGTLLITPAAEEKYNLTAWSPNREQLHVKIYSDVEQESQIILFGESGSRFVVKQLRLQSGVNNTTLNVGHVPPGTYILGVNGQKFKNAVRVIIR